MARSADRQLIRAPRNGWDIAAAGLLAYAIAFLVLSFASLWFDSNFAWLVIWIGLYPAFNVTAGYLAGRTWFAAVPMSGVTLIVALEWVFDDLTLRGVVWLLSFLVFGALCVTAGVALKLRRSRQSRGWMLSTAAIMVTCVGFLIAAAALELFVASDPDCDDFKLRTVASEAWGATRYDGRTERVYMAENAVRCGSLIGMTAAQIKAHFPGSPVDGDDEHLTLDLGARDAFLSMEYGSLEVDFNRSTGRAERAKVIAEID